MGTSRLLPYNGQSRASAQLLQSGHIQRSMRLCPGNPKPVHWKGREPNIRKALRNWRRALFVCNTAINTIVCRTISPLMENAAEQSAGLREKTPKDHASRLFDRGVEWPRSLIDKQRWWCCSRLRRSGRRVPVSCRGQCTPDQILTLDPPLIASCRSALTGASSHTGYRACRVPLTRPAQAHRPLHWHRRR